MGRRSRRGGGDKDMSDDGVALQSTSHPVHITPEMHAAGVEAWKQHWVPQSNLDASVDAIFTAMYHAMPPLPEDIDDDAIVEEEIELPQLVTATNYHDVVAVALQFADLEWDDMAIFLRIKIALKGMSNPAELMEEIERQRST